MSSKLEHYIFYRSVEISVENEIWRPIIAFGNLLNYEKTKFYGGDKPFSFYYVGYYKYIVYGEEVQLSFSCPFNFENYPFDSHLCTLEFLASFWPSDKLRLLPKNIYYEHAVPPIKYSLGDDPFIVSDLSHPFEFEFNFKPAFEKINVHNFSSSYVGLEIKMKRKTLGELLSGYYYPMTAFALLSMISFLIKPDVVSNK